MKKIFGNTQGLKANQVRRLEKFYSRKIPTDYLISYELARDAALLSHEIKRQIGFLIDRSGRVHSVIVGDPQRIVIPDIPEFRTVSGRLKGLRCVHTHLKDEPLTGDDLTDLALLLLDMMAVITITDGGLPKKVYMGHILPRGGKKEPYRIFPPIEPGKMDIGCLDIIRALEDELAQVRALIAADKGKERAILVSVTTSPRRKALEALAELEELADSCDIHVIETILQQRKKVDSRFLMGRGKLNEINLIALQKGASLIIFDQELNPSQIRSITDRIELKIIDRTQLILDIFAQRAHTREGKLQVELAQLKYLLPRLVAKNTAMSRLTGGIGGRGPGETKLEINRRRVRDRITRLGKALELVRKQRKQRKAKRERKRLPVISIIGYTNAGKSTLLNTLTQSKVLAESRLFATLDPSSRRLRFPRDVEVIITDTVGFINDLPKDLMVAFRATLEELEGADLLFHVIDISNPRCVSQIKSVEKILWDLDLKGIPVIRVLNKMDRVSRETLEKLTGNLGGVPISAKTKKTLGPLIREAEEIIEKGVREG